MDLIISIIVGISQAFIFNPVDKAIYNSITTNTALFKQDNWVKPFSGVSNNIYMRMITSGLYFYLIDHTKNMNVYQSALTVSATTSIVLNPLNIVKYKSYSDKISTYNAVITIYRKHGLKFGLIGLETLLLRNFVFNIVYISNKKESNDLVHNCGVICAASLMSSPFQYFINMKYYENISYIKIASNFIKCVKTTNNKIGYVFKQFAIGYGTSRTIVGVYTGQLMYSTLKQMTQMNN
jgi:hypothetical protein